MGFRAQASIEYLMVFIFAIGIVLAVYYLFFASAASMAYLAPQSCSFAGGVTCHGFVVASNATSSVIALLGSNANPYEMKSLSMQVYAGSSPSSISCSPKVIAPGAPFMCFGVLANRLSVGSSVSAKVIANAQYCPLDNCAGSISESYAGSINAYVTPFSKPKYGITLSTPVYAKPNTYVNVNLDVLGHNFSVEKVIINGANVSSIAYSPYAYFVNLSQQKGSQNLSLSVAFAGSQSNETVTLASNSTSMYCSLNQTNLLLELILTVYYSQFITYPSNMTLFNCPVSNGYVYCASNSSAYFATLANAEQGVWKGSNPVPTSNAVFACIVYNSQLYCFTRTLAYVANVSSKGIGSWSSTQYPVALSISPCTYSTS